MNRDNNVWFGIAGFIILTIGFQSEALAAPSPTGTDRSPKARLVETYGKLPLSFEENQGQTGDAVKFLSRGPGYTLFLTPTEAVLSLRKPEVTHQTQLPLPSRERAGVRGKVTDSTRTASTALRMQLIGANPKPQVSGVDALPGKVNYFRGKDRKQWHTHIPTYAKVKYENVWPGIDLVHYGNQRQLEHDFVVAPGGDLNKIRLNFAGAEKLAIDGQGDLVLKTAGGDVRLRKPRVYQDIKAQRREIDGRYVLHSPKTQSKAHVGFQVAAYDKATPLIIDPVLVYSTYLGGGDYDYGLGIAVDNAGQAYVTGVTESADFPTVNPLQGAWAGPGDAFVAKIDAAGSALLYATYLGGSDYDVGLDIAVDSAGQAYLTGQTYSPDFPTVNPLQGSLAGSVNAFVAKLNTAGSALLFSTYLGGSVGEGGNSIAVDGAGQAYLTGWTTSADFPTVNPLQGSLASLTDAFVAKLNMSGSALLYSTYLGGSDYELGLGIAVDSADQAYVTGVTESADFPTVNPLQGSLAGSQDAFVAKLDAAGSALLYSSYLGGSVDEGEGSIAVDSAGQAYVTGRTDSADFPTVNPLQGALAGSQDAFVAKLDAVGSALLFSTYLGGSNYELGLGIAVDSAGQAYLTGWTRSPDFPTVNPLQGSLAGSQDAFVAKLDAAGSALLFSTYLGGSVGEGGNSIAVDGAGQAYVTGRTDSPDFPTVNPLQGSLAGDDAFVAKIDAAGSAAADLVLTMTDSPDPVTAGSNLTYTVTVTNNGPSNATGVTVADTPPGGVGLVSAAPSQGSCAGTATVSCGLGSLANGATATVTIVVTPSAAGAISDSASASGNETDPIPGNNSDTESTTVTAPVFCAGRVVTMIGTAGADTLNGTAGPDVIAGLGGHDVINGFGGDDVICGGPGNDSISGGDGRDRLYGEGGRDHLRGGSGRDRNEGGSGNDRMNGGSGKDTCKGGSGTNTATSCENVTGVP